MNKKDKVFIAIILLTVLLTLFNFYLATVSNSSTEEMIKIEIEGILKLLELFLNYYF